MTQPTTLELAKQGNAQAIAKLMNQQFQPKGILVKANSVEGCLQIIFESAEAPQQQKLANYAYTAITKLNSPFIEKLIIYGKQSDNDFPNWQQEFVFSDFQDSEIKQSNEITVDKISEQNDFIIKPVEDTKHQDLLTRARSGDIYAIKPLIEKGFSSKVSVSPEKKKDCLILTLKFSEKIDSQMAIQIVIKILNDINPMNIPSVHVIGVRLWPRWIKYLYFVSDGYKDVTKLTYILVTSLISILLLYLGYATLIYKPNSSTASSSSSTVSSSSTPHRTSLGFSPTGYELLLEGSCVIVKDVKTSDFARLNTTLEGFKNAVKQQTGYQCVLFE